jgi:TPR repeat protein
MLVETMPGLDAKLVQAIDEPDAVPEQPATARRKKAIDRITTAAERAYVHVQYGMARRYLLGQGVPRDPAAGAEWLQQATEWGHVPSQLLLGHLAARGYGRERNLSDAMTWSSLAADTGDPNAASAARIMEPTLDSSVLLEARRNIKSWRSAFGQVEETTSTGGDNTPKSAPLQEAVAAGDLPEVRSVLARGEDA